MSSTGEKIRAARAARVIGQAELARAAGIDPVALWKIEHDKRAPRPATLRKLAEAMGTTSGKPVDPVDLLGDQGQA
jgi:transcriptional regulator with XRE-family HTH domain